MSTNNFQGSAIILLCFSLIIPFSSCKKVRHVCINENEFRDKVYACWLGKNIGGTLGMPFEGDTSVHDLTFYTVSGRVNPQPTMILTFRYSG